MNKQNKFADLSFAGRALGSPRAGVSVLEIVGCLMALVGGVWLGAIYLGVDVRHITYAALSESTLIDKMPDDWRPTDPAAAKAPSAAEMATKVQNELVSLRDEITTLRDSQPAQATAPKQVASSAAPADEDAVARKASLAYWSRLNEVVHRQATLQLEAESAANEGNATKVASLKARISRFSAEAIRALATADVDPTAAKLGGEIAAWYDDGADLYEQAVQVWESPARSQVGQPLTQEWERDQVQYQNEGRLLRSRVSAVRDSLARRFGGGFAPLAGL
jgi:hypothetical protein